MTKPTSTENKPAAVKKVASTVSYRLDEDRVIHRTDKAGERPLVRLTDEGGLEYVDKDARKLHPAVIKFLGDEKIEWNPDMVFVKAKEGEEDDASAIVDENSAEYEATIPPAPKQTREAGDKTPAFVEWMKKHKPKTYRQKYGIIGEGRVQKTRPAVDPETGRPITQTYVKDATLATRKTHLTEKVEAQVDDDAGAEQN